MVAVDVDSCGSLRSPIGLRTVADVRCAIKVAVGPSNALQQKLRVGTRSAPALALPADSRVA